MNSEAGGGGGARGIELELGNPHQMSKSNDY